MKKLTVKILIIALFSALSGPLLLQRSLFMQNEVFLFNQYSLNQDSVDGPLWLNDNASGSESKSWYSKWEPVILTVAIGGAVYLLYTVRSS